MYFDELTDQIFNQVSQFIDGYWDKMGYEIMTIKTLSDYPNGEKTVKISSSKRDIRFPGNDKKPITTLTDGMYVSLYRQYNESKLNWFRAKKMIKQYFNDITDQEEKQTFIAAIRFYKNKIKIVGGDYKNLLSTTGNELLDPKEFLYFLDDINFYLTNLEELFSNRTKKKEPVYNDFAEIFKKDEYYKKTINYLKELRIISNEMCYIKGNREKSIFKALIDVLIEKEYIYNTGNKHLLTELINKEFPGLEMSNKILSKDTFKSGDYKLDFQTL